MIICPRNAASYGHTITEEKHADEWCQRMKGKHCEGCKRNKAIVKESVPTKKAQRRLF